jgi:RND family efflux transporter MFP subunit
VHVEKFQNVQPQESILTLVSLGGGLEAKIDVPASVVATSQSRQHEQAFVILEAAPAVRIPAVFKEAALEAVSESQTYEVKFSFEAPDDLVILPGMNATVVIESSAVVADGETSSAGVAIPLDAVLSEGDRNYVWVIEPEAMTASKRWVTLEAGIGETAVVTDGLEPGERIAGAGAAYLAEGMKVRPWTE